MYQYQPPRSSVPALFPYTTLFRSCASVRSCASHSMADTRALVMICLSSLARNSGMVGTVTSPALMADRKSTRLNSSHVKNSYAVFCLKKKKGNYTNQTAHSSKQDA